MKRKITAAAAFALCVAMGVCACSPSEKEDTFTGKEKEELAFIHLTNIELKTQKKTGLRK